MALTSAHNPLPDPRRCAMDPARGEPAPNPTKIPLLTVCSGNLVVESSTNLESGLSIQATASINPTDAAEHGAVVTEGLGVTPQPSVPGATGGEDLRQASTTAAGASWPGAADHIEQ